MEEMLIIAFLAGVFGILAWVIEGPIGQRWNRWRARRQQESVEDAQTTSERGLGGWGEP